MKKIGITVKKTHVEGFKVKASAPFLIRTLFIVFFWMLKNFGYISKKRKHVNSKRIRSTKELIEIGLIMDL